MQIGFQFTRHTAAIRTEDKISSKAELMDLFGVSRHIIHKAIEELQYKGHIHTLKRNGSFVREIKSISNQVLNESDRHR